MKHYVKYMVSQSCILMVQEELKKLGIWYVEVKLGVIDILEDITSKQREQLQENLQKMGLVLLDDKRSILVESIKNVIIEMIHYSEEKPKTNYADYISKKLGYEYTYLANVFSEVKGITIRQFIILNKVERVKELILYDQLSLKEIAYRLNYNNVPELSSQFKKITGLTTAFYKEIADKRRENIDDV